MDILNGFVSIVCIQAIRKLVNLLYILICGSSDQEIKIKDGQIGKALTIIFNNILKNSGEKKIKFDISLLG